MSRVKVERFGGGRSAGKERMAQHAMVGGLGHTMRGSQVEPQQSQCFVEDSSGLGLVRADSVEELLFGAPHRSDAAAKLRRVVRNRLDLHLLRSSHPYEAAHLHTTIHIECLTCHE